MWLDLLSAKARYAMWLDGVLPSLVPWLHVFQARGAGAARQRAQAMKTAAAGGDAGALEEEEEEEDVEGGAGGSVRYAVRLRGLRHPLLLGDYLKVGSKHLRVCACAYHVCHVVFVSTCVHFFAHVYVSVRGC